MLLMIFGISVRTNLVFEIRIIALTVPSVCRLYRGPNIIIYMWVRIYVTDITKTRKIDEILELFNDFLAVEGRLIVVRSCNTPSSTNHT